MPDPIDRETDTPTEEQVAEAFSPFFPQHIDYERLNGIMREIHEEFGRMSTPEEFEAYIGQVVDPDALAFVSTAASMATLGIASPLEAQAQAPMIGNQAMLVHKSFLLGYRYARLKEESP